MKTRNRVKKFSLGRTHLRFTTVSIVFVLILSVCIPSIIVFPKTASATGAGTLPFDANQTGVSAGGLHSLRADGKVWAWGDNTYGQLGDGTTIQRSTPVVVQGLKAQASTVAAGGTHSLALLQDQSVAAWGNNDHGQLGEGT
ncbi:MAG: hypothetical protein Q8912_15855, partial [Bacillota bacterium]|nr:hypothetical protein [Bacillota bacterium]